MDHAMRVLRLVERENIDDVYPVNVSKKWFHARRKAAKKNPFAAFLCGLRLCVKKNYFLPAADA